MKKKHINVTYRNLNSPMRKKSDITSYHFFNYECTQEDGIDRPNLCIIHNETGDERMFLGKNTIQNFVNGYLQKNIRDVLW